MTRRVYGSDGLTYVPHQGRRRRTPKATLFVISGGAVWIPNSLIKDESDEIVAVPTWFAEKNELPDWETSHELQRITEGA